MEKYRETLSRMRENLICDIKALLREKMRVNQAKSIDVFYYTNVLEITDRPSFPTCDKNGYGILVNIATIKMDEKHGWIFEMDDECDESWDDWTLSSDYDFSTEGLISVLELLQEIFAYCEKNSTKIVEIGDYDYTTDTLAR